MMYSLARVNVANAENQVDPPRSVFERILETGSARRAARRPLIKRLMHTRVWLAIDIRACIPSRQIAVKRDLAYFRASMQSIALRSMRAWTDKIELNFVESLTCQSYKILTFNFLQAPESAIDRTCLRSTESWILKILLIGCPLLGHVVVHVTPPTAPIVPPNVFLFATRLGFFVCSGECVNAGNAIRPRQTAARWICVPGRF